VTTAPAPSPAFELAQTHQPSLKASYGDLHDSLCSDGCKNALTYWLKAIEDGRPAINTSVAGVVRVLAHGQYLNKYEVVRQSLAPGEDFQQKLQESLREYYGPRTEIDDLLKLGDQAHYGYLNVGGSGPTQWGECSMIFDRDQWLPLSTCFAGDSINACFKKQGGQFVRVLTDDLVFTKFAVGPDAHMLATIRNHATLLQLGKDPVGVDAQAIVQTLEAKDTFVEIHLMGTIVASAVSELVLSRSTAAAIWRDVLQWERLGQPETAEFDRARQFAEMIRLLKTQAVPVRLV
jgi:hypothetical protein